MIRSAHEVAKTNQVHVFFVFFFWPSIRPVSLLKSGPYSGCFSVYTSGLDSVAYTWGIPAPFSPDVGPEFSLPVDRCLQMESCAAFMNETLSPTKRLVPQPESGLYTSTSGWDPVILKFWMCVSEWIQMWNLTVMLWGLDGAVDSGVYWTRIKQTWWLSVGLIYVCCGLGLPSASDKWASATAELESNKEQFVILTTIKDKSFCWSSKAS